MASDVKLDGDRVVIEGSIHEYGAEIFLDRLKKGGKRRALVHDLNDQLLLNCSGDYPSGVKMWGPVTVENNLIVSGDVQINRLLSGTKVIYNPPKGTFLLESSELVLRSNTIEVITYPPSIAGTPSKPKVLDLVDEIKKLRTEIDALKKKL